MTENEIEKITLIVKNRKGLSKAIRHITGIVERNFISEICKDMANSKTEKYKTEYMTANGNAITITVEIKAKENEHDGE